MICRTEFSFRVAIGRVEQCFDRLPEGGIVADSTCYGHVPWAKEAKKRGLPRGLGSRIRVGDPDNWVEVIIVPTSNAGLRDLYALVGKAARKPLPPTEIGPGDWTLLRGADAHGKTPRLPKEVCVPFVPGALTGSGAAFSDNRYPGPEDQRAWAFSLGAKAWRTAGAGHIQNPWELEAEGASPKALEATRRLLARANEVALPSAQNIKFPVPDPQQALAEICRAELARRGLSAKSIYAERLERELKLVDEKKFADYFLVIADTIRWAKERMLVGPGRGSSAGSLLCWLLRVTEIDPIPHKLLFERFIDVNRFDLPDIDIDFPDEGRGAVLDYLAEKYGEANVAHIGTVMRYKPKSALTDVAKELKVPPWELDSFKDVIIERSSGDARANSCLADSMQEFAAGRALLKKYPDLAVACELEGGARQSGKHAAGMIVCNEPVSYFCAVDDNRTAQIDKKMAEALNVLKIDALGLRTLSVLETACRFAGLDRDFFYSIPLEDEKTLGCFNRKLWSGVFQFEGNALQSLASQIHFKSFEDIAALTALARPGPLGGGGATRWVEKHEGRMPPNPLHPMLKALTADTFGEILYQEQVMTVCREVGKFSWEDTSAIRKVMSDRRGNEAFGKYEEMFIKGASENGVASGEAKELWRTINSMGCLSGETSLKNPFPNHATPKDIRLFNLADNRGYIRKRIDYLEGDATKHRGPKSTSGEKYDIVKRQQLYALTPSTQKIVPVRCLDAFSSGIKTTFKIEVDSGEKIRATANHRFLTMQGWIALEDLRPGQSLAMMGATAPTERKKKKNTGSGRHNWRDKELAGEPLFASQRRLLRKRYKLCQNCFRAPYQETHHKNGDHNDHRLGNLLPVCRSCHRLLHGPAAPHSVGKEIRWATILSIGSPREEEVFDVSMPFDFQNFIANGFIVHNSWAFNRAHSAAYGVVSWWCGYMKAHHPLAFAAGCLRHAKDDEAAMQQLRELDREGIPWKPIDPKTSREDWEIVDGVLVGGLLGLKGVGARKAAEILRRRDNDIPLTPGLEKLLSAPSVFANAFPTRTKFGAVYKDPRNAKLIDIAGNERALKEPDILREIAAIREPEGVYILAKLIKKAPRDLNDDRYLSRRNGQRIENPTKMLILHLQDDTGKIIGLVGRHDYEALGVPIMEKGVAGESWFAIRGFVNDKRFFQINGVMWLK